MNKKLNIKDIEKKLGKKLKIKTISIGFDVAAKITGIAVLKTYKSTLEIVKLHKITYKFSKNIKDSLTQSMEYFIGELNNFISGIDFGRNHKVFVIEDCFMRFNVLVLKTLARFGVLAWRETKHISDEIYFIMPNVVRKKVGFKKDKDDKRKAKRQVLDYVNGLFGLELKAKDMDLSDALVLALGGLIE